MSTTTISPLAVIDTSFENYVSERERRKNEHMEGGVPDYAFSLDYELRQKIMKIPHFYSISHKIVTTIAARELQMVNQSGLAVGPDQFPHIYQMGVDCARRLGIGVPNIFVVNNSTMNAYAVAVDDISPVIVLYSGIVERMTPGELKCVIAHECGHIHNQHGVLSSVVSSILGGAASGLGSFLLSAANLALMLFWTRTAEVTADRAALICSDDVTDALRVDEKLIYGGAMNNASPINLEALRKQLNEVLENPTKIYEWGSIAISGNEYSISLKDHPSSIRRVFAELEFEECEVFYKWRPDLRKPGVTVRSKQETDERCKKLVNILNNK